MCRFVYFKIIFGMRNMRRFIGVMGCRFLYKTKVLVYKQSRKAIIIQVSKILTVKCRIAYKTTQVSHLTTAIQNLRMGISREEHNIYKVWYTRVQQINVYQ